MQGFFQPAREGAKKLLTLLINLFSYLSKKSSESLALFSLISISIITFSFLIFSHAEYKLIGGGSDLFQESSSMIISGSKFYDDLEDKVNNFRKVVLESDVKWVMPESLVDIEIFLASGDRIDEVAKTIHMSGYITANYFKSDIKTPYLVEGSRTLGVKEDLLSLSYLNFSNVDAQYFEPVSVNYTPVDDDTLVDLRYAFEGEFPLITDLSKFPFESAQWQIKLRVPLSAPGVFLNIDNDSFNFPDFNVDAFYFADPGCDEYLPLVCTVDEVVKKGEIIDASVMQKHLDKFDEVPYNADGVETVEEARAWEVVDTEPVIGLKGSLRRSIGSSFFRFVFPVMAVTSLLILFENINNEKYLELKIGAPPTVFLTLIFMQSGYQAQLPQIAYITYLDKLYIIGYLLSVISLSRSILAARVAGKDCRNSMHLRVYRIRKNLKVTFYGVLFLGPWLAWIA